MIVVGSVAKVSSIQGNPNANARESLQLQVLGPQSVYTSTDCIHEPPDDFESITVLKDASASSIYGSGSTNGVIRSTTKKGGWRAS